MNSFISRPMVTTQTVGERLKKVREGSGFSLEEVSRRTGIAVRYLAGIEAGEYAELPGEIYCLEFIKTYARFLRLDEIAVAEAYRAEKQCAPRLPSPRQRRMRFPGFRLGSLGAFTAGRALVFAALAGLVAWASLAVAGASRGPRLEVFSPVPYHRIHDSRVALAGKAAPGSTVTVNNQRVPLDPDGSFYATFNAPPGLTLLRISATDDRGRSATEYRTVVVAPGEVAGASAKRHPEP